MSTKRISWRPEESIKVFQILIENKSVFFNYKKCKKTDDFYKLPIFDELQKDWTSLKFHIDNCRKSYRKKIVSLESTGNNDEKEELFHSQELFEVIKQFEDCFYPRGSNISPKIVMEPSATCSRAETKRPSTSITSASIDFSEPVSKKTRNIETVVDEQTKILRSIEDKLCEVSEKLSQLIEHFKNKEMQIKNIDYM